MHDQGNVRSDDERDRSNRDASDRGPLSLASGVGHHEGCERRQHHDPEDMTLHRHRHPCGCDQPPARTVRRPGAPGAGQCEGRGESNQVRVPNERGALHGCRGHAQEEGCGQASKRAGHRAGQPPRDRDCSDPGQSDLADHPGRIAAAQPGRRREEVVIEGAVVEVPDRGGRAQERPDATSDKAFEHDHVVALVGIPRAARRQVVEAKQDRQPDDRHKAEKF